MAPGQRGSFRCKRCHCALHSGASPRPSGRGQGYVRRLAKPLRRVWNARFTLSASCGDQCVRRSRQSHLCFVEVLLPVFSRLFHRMSPSPRPDASLTRGTRRHGILPQGYLHETQGRVRTGARRSYSGPKFQSRGTVPGARICDGGVKRLGALQALRGTAFGAAQDFHYVRKNPVCWCARKRGTAVSSMASKSASQVSGCWTPIETARTASPSRRSASCRSSRYRLTKPS